MDREKNMAHFWVRIAMKKLTVDQGAPANACTDGEVDQVTNALPGTPAAFSQNGSINIRVKANGQVCA